MLGSILAAFFLLNILVVNGVDPVLMTILDKTRPDFSMPPLDVYREIVSKLVDFEKCNASVNFVAQYFVVQNIWSPMLDTSMSVPVKLGNKTIFPPFVEVYEPFTRLPIRIFARWVYEKYVNGESMSRLGLLHWWIATGVPALNYRFISIDRALYLYLDESLFVKGYLYALKWYIRFNETHLIDLDIALDNSWLNSTAYVYCPIPEGEQFREAFKVIETTTFTLTVMKTIVVTTVIPTTVGTTITSMLTTTISTTLKVPITVPIPITITSPLTIPTTITVRTTETKITPTTIQTTLVTPTTITTIIPTTMLLATTYSTTVVSISLSTSTVTEKVTDWTLTGGLAVTLLVVGIGLGLRRVTLNS